MLKVNLICHGTLKEKYLTDAVNEYKKRLTAFCDISVIECKDDKTLMQTVIKNGKDYIVSLCVEGKMIDSPTLADMIDKLPQEGYSGVSFIIGGSDGLPEEIKKLSKFRLSFSRMTFPHQLMRVILIEQVYRAFTIINNGKYHK